MLPIQANGLTPITLIPRIPARMLLIPLNGMVITRLIPPMIPLTTVLNVPRIPSVIPMKIRPPVENTSRTPAQAFEKMLLNQFGIVEKMLVIVFHAPWKMPRKNSTTPENTALMPPQMPLNQEPATLNTFTIPFHAFLNIVPNHVATFESAFTTSFHLSLNH